MPLKDAAALSALTSLLPRLILVLLCACLLSLAIMGLLHGVAGALRDPQSYTAPPHLHLPSSISAVCWGT